jgi:tRNA pseudouridine55 synthase
MPKVPLPPLPLSALFAVAKPSGPTSMSIINDIKQLVVNSRLFVEAEKLEKGKGKQKGAGGKGKRGREVVKIGQGGTLDPLADGVLGEYISELYYILVLCFTHMKELCFFSCRDWKRDKKVD